MPNRLSVLTQTTVLAAFSGLIDGDGGSGTIDIYSGAQPALPEDTATGILLATIVLPLPSFTIAEGEGTGVDPGPVLALTSGTAGWFRIFTATGRRVMDGEVTLAGGGGGIILANLDLVAGSPVDLVTLALAAAGGLP